MSAIDTYRRLLINDMRGRLAIAWDELESERAQLERLSPVWQVSHDRQRIETLAASLQAALGHRLALDRERVASAQGRLDALSPLQILKRGYAIVRDLDTGQVVSSVRDAQAGHLLEIRVSDGAFGARTERPRISESLDTDYVYNESTDGAGSNEKDGGK
jgi:exodeoxyribonuclease VII large subunit